MLKKRVIAKLAIKNNLLVQSAKFKTHLPIGDPTYVIDFLSRWEIDEIIIVNIDQSKKRNLISSEIIKTFSKGCFIPLTVGGGIENLKQVESIFKSGAEKITLNTSALENPQLIKEISKNFGSQSIVLSIDFKKNKDNSYSIYSRSGSKKHDVDLLDWINITEEFGVGEYIFTSINREGTKEGYDLEFLSKVYNKTNKPIIISGGVKNFYDFITPIKKFNVSGVCASNIFFHSEHSVHVAKSIVQNELIELRTNNSFLYNNFFDKDGRPF